MPYYAVRQISNKKGWATQDSTSVVTHQSTGGCPTKSISPALCCPTSLIVACHADMYSSLAALCFSHVFVPLINHNLWDLTRPTFVSTVLWHAPFDLWLAHSFVVCSLSYMDCACLVYKGLLQTWFIMAYRFTWKIFFMHRDYLLHCNVLF